jgi:ribonucleoside-diphosphate reductase alpha chain
LHVDFDEEMRRRNINIPDMFDVIFNEHNGSIQKMNIPEDIKRVFATAHDIPPEWHVRMQSAFQKHTGNSISKTINMKKDSTIEDIDEAYRLSYKLGCKGVTIYRDGSKSAQILSSGVQSQPSSGGNGGFGPRVRIEAPIGRTYEIPFGFGDALITVNEDDIGLCEVIIKAGRAGSPIAAEAESLGRLVSLLMRCGVATKNITKQLRGISAGETAFYKGGRTITSLADAVSVAIENYVGLKESKTKRVQTTDKYIQVTYKQSCPECGMPVLHQSKCVECPSCGWSKCK